MIKKIVLMIAFLMMLSVAEGVKYFKSMIVGEGMIYYSSNVLLKSLVPWIICLTLILVMFLKVEEEKTEKM